MIVVLTGSERNTGGFFTVSTQYLCILQHNTQHYSSFQVHYHWICCLHYSVRVCVLQYGYSITECHEKKEKMFVFLCSRQILMFLLFTLLLISRPAIQCGCTLFPESSLYSDLPLAFSVLFYTHIRRVEGRSFSGHYFNLIQRHNRGFIAFLTGIL